MPQPMQGVIMVLLVEVPSRYPVFTFTIHPIGWRNDRPSSPGDHASGAAAMAHLCAPESQKSRLTKVGMANYRFGKGDLAGFVTLAIFGQGNGADWCK
jgi:hypothetical protein